jgi:hypothetical protein
MDPNAALDTIREAATNLRAQLDSDDPSSSAIEQEAGWLAEHFEALDGWLLKGGFLPDEWKAAANS